MATPIDTGILEHFGIIFTFLFVMTVSYGVLELTKVLGENKGLHGLVAFCLAVFLSFSNKPAIIIQGIIPWFVLLFVFGMFLLVGMRFIFGDKGDQMMLTVMGGEGAGWWVFAIAIGILLITVGTVIGPEVTPGVNQTDIAVPPTDPGSTATGDWRTNVLNTIYDPKILGTVVLLLIAAFAIKLISSVPKV